MSGLKAKARAAVAAALVAVFVFVPSPARADGGDWWWWLPPSWMDVIAGTAEVALNIWKGVEQPVSGGSESFVADPVPDYAYRDGTNWHRATFAGLDERGLPLIRIEWAACVPGSDSGYFCNNNEAAKAANFWSARGVVVVLADGYEYTNAQWQRNDALGLYRISNLPTNLTSEHGPIVRVFTSTPLEPTNPAMTGATWWADASLAVTTTEIVCRSASGDFTVSETSAAGATVAPSPVCPPGSFPVRITVTNSVDGVLSDTSITAPDWYLADPSGVEFGFTVDGTICQPGRPGCDELLENPHFWDPTTNGCYARQRNLDLLTSLNVSYPAAIPGPGDGWIRVPDEFCLDRPGSDLPISQPPETPDDPDLGVISRGIDRLIEAVKAAGSSVASGVRAVGEKIAGFRSDMNEKIEGFRQDMKNGFDRVVEGIAGIGDSGDGDGDGEGQLPGDTGDLLGRAGDALGEPFADWVDALGGIPAAFSVPASDCMGPAWTIPGGGTHYPFQTCTGEAAKVARIVYVMTGAAVSLVGLLAIVRLLGAAIGVQVNSGASQE